MPKTFGKPFVTQEEVRTRIRELGRQISQDYQGKDLVVIGVLKGAYVFFADLVREIQLPIQIDFLIAKGTKKSRTFSKNRQNMVGNNRADYETTCVISGRYCGLWVHG